MRMNPWLLACSALLAAACTPSRGPEGGGQTGDPGVTDFTSLDPDANGTPSLPGGGSCLGAVTIAGESADGLQARKLGEGHLAVFDPQRGLSIVQTAAPAPRVVGHIPLAPCAGSFHVSGAQGFLTTRNLRPAAAFFANGYPAIGDDAQLLSFDLSDPEQPRLLDALPLDRAPRTSILVVSEGRTRLYVLSDGGAAQGCAGGDDARRLVSYEWSEEHFVARAELSLSADLRQIRRIGQRLLLERFDAMSGPSYSIVSLANADGSMQQGQAFSALLDSTNFYAEDEHTWRFVGAPLEDRSVPVYTYDVRDPNAVVKRGECSVGRVSAAKTTFTPGHTFFVEGVAASGWNTVTSAALRADGSCEVLRHNGRGRVMQAAGKHMPARVLDLDSDARGVVVRLLDDADLSVIGEAVVPTATGVGWDGMVSRTFPGRDESLFGVTTVSAPGSDMFELQLFGFSSDQIRLLGSLAPAFRLDELDTNDVLAWTGWSWNAGGLARVELDDLGAPRLSEVADISPSFSQVFSLETHWARMRLPAGIEPDGEVSDDERWSPTRRASLELVPIDGDPDRDESVASAAANPRGRLYRAGSRLVSVVNGNRTGEPTALIEVFDVSDPEHVVRSAELFADSFAQPPECIACAANPMPTYSVLALSDALVRIEAAGQPPSLRVLDVHEPSAPVLSEPIALSDGRGVSAFVDGTSVYYAYREASGGGVRFYFRRVDLSHPAAPQLGPAINVPGELVAVAGEQLYTREYVRSGAGGSYETQLHRLRLHVGAATLEATHSLGSRAAFSFALDAAGHLLVDLREELALLFSGTFYVLPPVDLVLLDATTLAQVGETRVAPYARRLAIQGKQALYSAAEGMALVNLAQPDAPFLQAYVPLRDALSGPFLKTTDGSVVFGPKSALYVDRGAIVRLDRATDNLAR
jgi:hypothetical protein